MQSAAVLSPLSHTPALSAQGGAVAPLPTAFVLNDCGSTAPYTATQGVAACSYVRAPPPGTGGDYFWLAGPWFDSRFVQFNLTSLESEAAGGDATKGGNAGTIRFSGLIDSCEFPPLAQ